MPPTKRPAPKRTSALKPVPVADDFDSKRAALVAQRKQTSVFEWEGYGRLWHLRRPNPALVAALEDADGAKPVLDFILGFIVEEERDDFYAAMVADEDMDFDILTLLTEQLSEVVYAEVPSSPSSNS